MEDATPETTQEENPAENERFVRWQRSAHDQLGFTLNLILTLNRAIVGYDEGSIYELLRSSTSIFILVIDAMYRLHHKKPNDALTAISDKYFAESWE